MSGWVAILIAVIYTIPPSILAWLAWRQGRASHHLMNSRLDQLLKLRGSSSRAKGRLEGLAEGKTQSKRK